MIEVGTVIDNKYEILKLIGQGGMSKVYLAMDKRLNKQWAIKEIRKISKDKNNEVVIEEIFDKVMDLNVKGVFNATRAVVDHMAQRGEGVILSTSSMVSISGQPSGFAYPASKFAVNGLTISLARELGPKGIRVNAVAPGITETDMMKAVPKEVIDPMIQRIPLRRLGQPQDIANAFVFLASDEASYITGVVLSVDGMARA